MAAVLVLTNQLSNGALALFAIAEENAVLQNDIKPGCRLGLKLLSVSLRQLYCGSERLGKWKVPYISDYRFVFSAVERLSC